MHISLGEIIGIIGILLTLIGGFWKVNSSLTSGLNNGIKEVEDKFDKALHEHVKEEDEKRKRVYDRLDEIKKFADERFVTKEIINIMHEGTAKNLSSLEQKFDAMRIEVKGDMNGICKGQNEMREAIIKLSATKP